MHNTLKTLTLTLLLASCSGYGGIWPKLNDPLPDASERNRIRATPDTKIAPYEALESEAIDLALHKSRHNVIVADIAKAWSVFDDKMNSIENELDHEDKLIAWTGSQLALSRVSAEINKLRNLADQPIVAPSESAEIYLKSIATNLAKYDQRLNIEKENIAAKKPS